MLVRAFDAFGRRDALTVDVLDASATTLLACQGQWPMALFMVWLVNLVDYIRDITVMQAQDAVQEVLAYRRTPAWVVRNGRTMQVNVEQVQVGETVVVYPGERIPVDGRVLKGKATHRGAGRKALCPCRPSWRRYGGRPNCPNGAGCSRP